MTTTTTPAARVSGTIKAMADVLEWYGEQARLARLIHKEGDAGRHALDKDGGRKACEALAAIQSDPEPNQVAFGAGKWVVVTGTFNGTPAVFIEPSNDPGPVGSSAEREGIPRDRLIPGATVLTFPSAEQAMSVADAICYATPSSADMPTALRYVPTLTTGGAATHSSAGTVSVEAAARVLLDVRNRDGMTVLPEYVREMLRALAGEGER